MTTGLDKHDFQRKIVIVFLPIICDYVLNNERFGVNLFFIKIYYAINACATCTFTFGKC